MNIMRAVVRQVPEQWLEERARLGHDRWDEIWDGVLHVPPPPSSDHQGLGSDLLVFVGPHLRRRGIRVLYETGVYRPGAERLDYRIPDLTFIPVDPPPGLVSRRGIEGAALAVLELLSPDDETYDKLPFYASLGIREVIVIDPATRAVDVYRLAGTAYVAVSADERGRVHAATIDVRFSTTEGALRVEHAGDATEL
jgi:Uma2 family endonuclease